MQKAGFDLELLLHEQKKILLSLISRTGMISSQNGKKQPNEKEINFLLLENGKNNLHYQAHAILIKSILTNLIKKNSKLAYIPIPFTNTISKEIQLDPSNLPLDISHLELLNLIEQLHFDFLNSEYVVERGVLTKRRSKINNREKGAVYTPNKIAQNIVMNTID